MAWYMGKGRILTPEFFPFCTSKDEVLGRVRVRAGMDESFRKRFDGAWISALRMDDSVRISRRIEDMRGHL